MTAPKTNPAQELTQGRLLARNTILNVLGYSLPMLVAIFAIPLLIKGLGTERFGILTLAWVIIGYLSLFDLGLGRALTKLVAEMLGEGHTQKIPALIWTSLSIMFFFGILVAVTASWFLPYLIQDLIKIPHSLASETLNAFYLLVFSVPVVIISVGFRGILDAYQRFDLTNMVRIPLGVYSFLAPLLVLPFTQNLFPVVGVLVVGRLIACMMQLLFCLRIVPDLRRGIVLERALVGPLIHFGSWMTVSNIVNPLMMYLDRFFIGAVISVSAVAYYATPSEVVTKLLLISGALMGVLFPAFSTSYVQDRNRTALLFERGVKYIFIAIFPLTLIIFTLAHDGLNLWLGNEFSQNSTAVLQWITVGVFIHSLGQVPYGLIQGAGRPDLTGKLHIVELPFYILGLWLLIHSNGIVGAAMAWFFRICLDTVCMFVIAHRLLMIKKEIMIQKMVFIGGVLPIFMFATFPETLFMKTLFLVSFLSIFSFATWFWLLDTHEKAMVLARFRMFGSQIDDP
jgi:O-antigen/teichoic acid export membrane protein